MTIDTTEHSSACACCGDMLRQRFDRRRFLHLSAGAMAFAAAPQLAFAASGNYEAMLLSCIDPRFPAPVMNYMKHRHLVGKYSQFNIAGASIGVVAPAFKTWAPAFWDNLGASIQLHNIKKVIVINHRDCGAAKIAYGADAVKDKAAETETHKNALMEFKKQLAETQPALKSELGLMALDGKLESFNLVG